MNYILFTLIFSFINITNLMAVERYNPFSHRYEIVPDADMNRHDPSMRRFVYHQENDFKFFLIDNNW